MDTLLSILVRAGMLAAFVGVLVLLGWLGLQLDRVRGPRAANEIRQSSIALGATPFFIGFGLAALVPGMLKTPGWEGSLPIFLALGLFGFAGLLVLIGLRWKLAVDDRQITYRSPFRPERSVPWGDVVSWRPGKQPDSVVLELSDRRRFTINLSFTEGGQVLHKALRRQKVRQSG